MNADRIKTTGETGDGGTTGGRGGGRTIKGTAADDRTRHRHDGEITEQTTVSGSEMSATGHGFVAAGGAGLSETKASENDARSLLEVGYIIAYLLVPMPMHLRNRFNQLKAVFERDLISESCCFDCRNDPLTSISVCRHKTH